jgi:hypothetical protein
VTFAWVLWGSAGLSLRLTTIFVLEIHKVFLRRKSSPPKEKSVPPTESSQAKGTLEASFVRTATQGGFRGEDALFKIKIIYEASIFSLI